MSEVVKKIRTEDGGEASTSVSSEADSPTRKVAAPESDKRLQEKDCGITEYISQHKGFSGVIKQRYSDFQVNEVGLDGSVVHLTDVSAPKCDVKEAEEPQDETPSVLSEEQLKELRALSEGKDADASVFIRVGDDKAERSLVHKAIRSLFSNLDSLTEEDESGARVIKVIVANHKKCKDKRFLRNNWPSTRPVYCHFVLYKENKDTMEAVNVLAKLSKLRAGNFLYAGVKDKRAKTSQKISIHKVTATRIYGLNKILRGMRVGNFEYCKNALKLGDHRGNRFNIVLRNVTGSDAQIQEGMTSLKAHGFINYYGMQRFGTTCVPTHHIGRAILKQKWQEAVDLILQPKEGGHHPCIAEACSIWMESRDAKRALEAMGNHHCLERHLLVGLNTHGTQNLVNALTTIPRYSRQMYIHSYQSYVWNCMTSRRISQLGMKPVVGDLVKIPSTENGVSSRDSIRILTPDDVADFHITDVVLPLPGHDVQLPGNEVSDWYLQLLAADELSMQHFKHKVRDYCMPGEQRHIVVSPGELEWSTVHYNDVTLPLTLSDAERLDGKTLPPPLTEGKYKALVVEFTLSPSSYATMALREIFKEDTSSAHQTTLNVS
ncbi:hypothetical protein CAPTEDRAFT_160486 [Capitella teleta]|uniref:TRUD domain-containing protein n=1 Tax=Capitella teleta TaxID=283909 RepID=R7TXH7_CAPTE|nr:hypothetical protein CAPTEDRAFT_160486 [Capitella teleta]|eukprot:ELT96146.1 hypothetical protein CAPTEDRAFT_160486 [Capitella teleta]